MKICVKCKTKKNKLLFSKNLSTKDKLSSWCKSCTQIASRKGFRKNPEQHHDCTKKWFKKNPGYLHKWHGQHPDYQQDWHDKNPKAKVVYSTRWRKKNSDKFAIIVRRWCMKNPDKVNALAAMRRAWKRKATIGDQKKVGTIYKRCQELRKWFNVVVDHRIPLSKGGSHSPSNLQIIYEFENALKSNKLDYKSKVIFV